MSFATSFHEAAHAVIGLRLGFKVYEVQVYPDDSGLTSYGMMRFKTVEDAERFSKLAMAGPVAELLLEGSPVTYADIELLDGASSDFARTGAMRAQFDFPDVLPEVISMVKASWAVIDSVAKRLDKERALTGDEIKAMIA